MSVPQELRWKIFMDGYANSNTSGVDIVVHTSEGGRIEQASKFNFPTTSNEAEYEAILAGLKATEIHRVKGI